MKTSPILYKRVLLKLSGEALMGDFDYGIDPKVINRIASEVSQVKDLGIQIALVIGGGNIFRGAGLSESKAWSNVKSLLRFVCFLISSTG